MRSRIIDTSGVDEAAQAAVARLDQTCTAIEVSSFVISVAVLLVAAVVCFKVASA